MRARLHPLGNGRYSVLFEGKLLVENSRDPECDAARALLAQGVTGKLTLCDGKTGIPRTIIDIEMAAKLTVREDRSRDPRFVKWKPMPEGGLVAGDGKAHSPESDGGGHLTEEAA